MESTINKFITNFTRNNFDSWEAWVGTFIFIVIAYFVGSINSGQIYSKMRNHDLGKSGSQNYGATNAGRKFGKKGFAFVFFGDFLKPIILGMIFSPIVSFSNVKIFEMANVGVALLFVYIGHVWPIWFKFKGGKGVAVSYGLLTVFNWIFAAIAGLMFLFWLAIFKKVSLASIFGVGTIMFLLFFQPIWFETLVFKWSMTWSSYLVGISIFVITTIKHIPNLIRIKKNKEPSLKLKIEGKKIKVISNRDEISKS